MALYVMIGWDTADGAQRRDQWRRQHVDYIHKLERNGRIRFAGPIRDNGDDRSIGVVIVYEASNLHDARNMANADPYVAGGVFETLTVHPFKQVIPEP